jgi:hypothetical protein
MSSQRQQVYMDKFTRVKGQNVHIETLCIYNERDLEKIQR